jgi:hypothetical protein
MGAARSPYTRSDWYLAFRLGPGADNVFSMLDDKAHARRRAQMMNGVGSRMSDDLSTDGLHVVPGEGEHHHRTNHRS